MTKKIGLFLISIMHFINADSQKISLQNGDFLLVGSAGAGLSKAIVEATQRAKPLNFDHIAIVQKTKDSTEILNANTTFGSCKESLSGFIQRETGNKKRKIAVYRLKKEFQITIPQALATANTMLGKPYNYTYILSDTAYYCSDFIQKAFAKDSIFALAPMSFMYANKSAFIPYWVAHYQRLNIPIPEGKLGCNPNEMASSDKLYFVGYLIK